MQELLKRLEQQEILLELKLEDDQMVRLVLLGRREQVTRLD